MVFVVGFFFFFLRERESVCCQAEQMNKEVVGRGRRFKDGLRGWFDFVCFEEGNNIMHAVRNDPLQEKQMCSRERGEKLQ